MTVADPSLTPVICAGVLGLVFPPEMKTLGETVSVVGSLLVSVMVAPPTGAGVNSVTLRGRVAPTPTVAFVGSEMIPNGATVMVAAELAVYPGELAVIETCPTVAPVNIKVPPDSPVLILTLPGIVTEPVPVADRVTVIPGLGAGAGKVIVPVAVFVSPTEFALKLSPIAGGDT